MLVVSYYVGECFSLDGRGRFARAGATRILVPP